MGHIRKQVNINELMLDEKNPRFASSNLAGGNTVTQSRIIKHLLCHANVEELAKRIRQVGELHPAESIVCCKEDNKYVVLEGNRRICACKLLLDNRVVPVGVTCGITVLNNSDAVEQEIINRLSIVDIVLYDTRAEVQDYLSDRHITGIRMWDSLEKDRYYYNLFQVSYCLADVEKNTSDTAAKIKERIKKYTIFLDVFNALKTRHTTLNIEDIPSYLPLVDQFALTLFEDYSVGLGMSSNAQLKFIPKVGKESVYNDILILVGEAFLMDTANRIVSNDPKIKTKSAREYAIRHNTAIPGLKALIDQYKAIPTPTGTPAQSTSTGGQTSPTSATTGGANSPPTSVPTGGQTPPASPTPYTPNSTYTPPSQQNNRLGFSQAEYNSFRLSGGSDGENKIIQIIRELSTLDIIKYPFACAVLYRTLLEAVANLKIHRDTTLGSLSGLGLDGKLSGLNIKLFISEPNKKQTIKTCLGGQAFIKMLNHYIHDLSLAVDVGTVLQTWVTMKELIKACLV